LWVGILSSRVEFSKNSKIILFVLFAIFLISMPRYEPYLEHNTTSHSILNSIFNLYFFIFNQTLGIVHEAGHGVCYILSCPKFITVLNGTLFQLLFPLGVALYYKYKGNRFGFLIGVFFFGFSLSYTAWYISTCNMGAVVPANRSFLGQEGYHDFYYILSAIGVLKYYGAISIFVKILAYLIMAGSVIVMFIEAL